MLNENTPKVKIENKQMIFRQFGAILALSLVFLAFEYKTDEINTMSEIQKSFDNTPKVEIVPLVLHEVPQPPMPLIVIESQLQMSDSDKDQKALDIESNLHQNDSFE